MAATKYIAAIALFAVESRGVFLISITITFNVDTRQFRVILSFSPKLPRTHVEFYSNVNKNIPRDSTVKRGIRCNFIFYFTFVICCPRYINTKEVTINQNRRRMVKNLNGITVTRIAKDELEKFRQYISVYHT